MVGRYSSSASAVKACIRSRLRRLCFSLSRKCSPRAGVLQARGIAQGHISGSAVLLARRPTSLKEGPDPGLQVVRKARLVESKVAARCPYRLMRILTDGSRERDDGDVL